MFKYGIFIALTVLILSCGKMKETSYANETQSARYTEMFHEGLRFKQKRQYDNAIKVFEACATLNPTDDAPHFALSEIFALTEQTAKSIASLENAVRIDPKNNWYQESLTYKQHQSGNFKAAIIGYKKLLSSKPQNAEWLLSLSECYLKSNNLKEAYQTLENLEKQIGENPELTIEKYRILRYLKEDKKGEELLLKGLSIFPNDPDLLANLIDYYFEKKKDEQAINLLAKLSEADPKNGNVHLSLAQYHMQHNDLPNTYKELKLAFTCPEIALENKTRLVVYFFDTQAKLDPNVLELANILVREYPNEAKVYTLQGDLLLKNNEEEKALNAFQQAIKLDPSKYSIWEQVLLMEYEFQRYEELYNDGTKAAELYPTHSKVYLLTGTAANQTKRYKEATDLLTIGKELVINNKELKAEFYAQLGQAYFKLKKVKEAQESYDEAIRISPANQLNLNNYAYYLAQEKIELEKAEKYIKEVLTVSPNDHHFLDTYGWVLFQQGKYQDALIHFQKALATNAKEPLITDHLGDTFFKLGKHEEAIQNWKKALELGSKNTVLPKKIEKKHYYDPIY